MVRIVVSAALAAALVVSLGCDKGPKIVEVNGRLLRNGQPVTNCTVHFTPLKGRPSWGASNEVGEFTLCYDLQRAGAEVGPHKVHVDFRPNDPSEENLRALGKLKWPPERKAILDKYGDRNAPAIEVEVPEKGGSIEIHLD